ncbi:MAG: cache domain-containing protein [Firmicutes bacterium]|nr:cache domain-containing protein [Bacillota bacterium]
MIARIPIRFKLAGIFLFLTLAPVVIIGAFSYCSFKAALTQKIVRYSLDGLIQTVSNIQLKLAEFENISVRLFINQEFNDTITSYLAATDAKTISRKKRDIESYFNEYMITNPDIYAFMFICGANAERSIVIAKDDYPDFINLTRNFKATATYQNILKAGGGIVWSSSIKLNLSHYLVLGRQIKDSLSGESRGILAIIIDEEKIDHLSNLNIYNQLNLSLGEIDNYGLIINSRGELISTPFKEDIGKNIAAIMRDIKPLKKILAGSVSDRDYGSEINQGSFITEVNHKQSLVVYKTIGSKIGVGGKSGWHLLRITPTSNLYGEVSMVGLLTMLTGLVFGILAVLSAIYIAANCRSIRHFEAKH